METLIIEYQANVKEKLYAILNSFDANEVKFVAQDAVFKDTKKILSQRLQDLKAGKSQLISIEDYEVSLDYDL